MSVSMLTTTFTRHQQRISFRITLIGQWLVKQLRASSALIGMRLNTPISKRHLSGLPPGLDTICSGPINTGLKTKDTQTNTTHKQTIFSANVNLR